MHLNMNSDIGIAMYESKDHDPRVSNETDSTVVEGEGEGGEIEEQGRIRVSEAERASGGSEGGNVMVEALSCEVFVDGVRGDNGEVSGGDGGKRESLGELDDRATRKAKVESDDRRDLDDKSIFHDKASEGFQGSVTSYGSENVNITCGIVYEGGNGSGISLCGNDDLPDGVTDVKKESVVDIGVELRLERNSGGVIELELDGGGNGSHADLFSCNIDAESNSNENEDVVQDSMTPVLSMGDGNVNALNEEGEDKGLELVERASVVSESRTKELVLEKAADTEHIASVEAISHGVYERAKEPKPVASEDMQVEVESIIQKVDGKFNPGSVLLETEVPDILVASSPTSGFAGIPKKDGEEECESHVAHGRPLFPDESFADIVDQEKGCAHDMEGVAQFDSNMEDTQEVQEDVDNSEQVELAEADEDEELFSDSATPQSNDENGELEGHTAHEIPHWPDESFVEDIDHGKKFKVTSPFDENDMVGSDIDYSQEEAEVSEEFESSYEQDVNEASVSYSTKRRRKEEKNGSCEYGKSGNTVKDHHVSYLLPPENEGEFSVFDLVWGKVKSHPWWPGQIFHPFDSSEKAKKYFRTDCYLVAYFGDKSFAWNEESVLKPFFKHFSQEEKQSNSESFQNAVSCALEEVSRRVELGLACSCISEEVRDKIKYQMVDNAGIHEDLSKREGVDWSTGADSFQPDQLIQYVKALALSPTSGTSRLDLVIAKAQMLSFYRLKGSDMLPDFQYYDGLLECDAGTSPHVEQREMELVDSIGGGDRKSKSKGPRRRKHNSEDIVYQRRKEKTLTELMGDSVYYFDGDFDSHDEDDVTPTTGTKRKASLYSADESTGKQRTKSISVAKVSNTASPNPLQSFKVGECIQRAASQLTGSSSIIKITDEDNNNKHLGDHIDKVSDHPNEVSDPPNDALDEKIMTPEKEASIDELLSQLHLSAQDPMKGYSFLPDVVSFFSDFRNLAVTTQRQRMRKSGRKRKQPSVPGTGLEGSATFEFEDKNDSYWTDMVIQNNSEVKPSKRGRKRKEDRVVSLDTEKPIKPRKYSRKQYAHGSHESTAKLQSGNEKQLEELPTGPTELVMTFSDAGSVPTEVNLNKMFRRFGPLKELETEIDTQSGRAKVVFKKRSDAEVAYSSATMFNIFGSIPVNYQLNYTPSVPTKIALLPLTDGQEYAT